jgi:hypothetical protein
LLPVFQAAVGIKLRLPSRFTTINSLMDVRPLPRNPGIFVQ